MAYGSRMIREPSSRIRSQGSDKSLSDADRNDRVPYNSNRLLFLKTLDRGNESFEENSNRISATSTQRTVFNPNPDEAFITRTAYKIQQRTSPYPLTKQDSQSSNIRSKMFTPDHNGKHGTGQSDIRAFATVNQSNRGPRIQTPVPDMNTSKSMPQTGNASRANEVTSKRIQKRDFTPEHPETNINPKIAENSKFRHLIGSIDHIIRWYNMSKGSNLKIFYECSGTVESMINRKNVQLIFLKSQTGHVLQAEFFSVDRYITTYPKGTILSICGRMVGANKLHVIDAVELKDCDDLALQRLWFLSERELGEALALQLT